MKKGNSSVHLSSNDMANTKQFNLPSIICIKLSLNTRLMLIPVSVYILMQRNLISLMVFPIKDIMTKPEITWQLICLTQKYLIRL